jgi:plasmid stabilization system protein ParE
MIRARFSPRAIRDLDEHCNFIAGDNSEAAMRVRQAILNLADFLSQHPELGRRVRNATLRHKDVRWFVVPKFRNYLIFYQPHKETILVIRVLHAAQDWTRFFGNPQNPSP